MRWDGPSEASGQRAARVLPCCFALLEAGVEALAEDTQASGGRVAPPGCRACCSRHASRQRVLPHICFPRLATGCSLFAGHLHVPTNSTARILASLHPAALGGSPG